MKEKIIKIFIGSSIDEFHDERNELDAFISKLGRNMRERYRGRDIYIDIIPIRCEDVDPAYSKGRKQDEFNALINECDMCIFLFFTKAGEYTVEEFEIARKAFEASEDGKPKIYTYFKQCNGSQLQQSVTDFMERLDKNFQHFYNVFDSIDTVKLQIMLNLSLINSEYIEVEFDNGKCYFNGREALGTDRLPQFANNGTLNGLKSELNGVETEYYALKGGYPHEDEDKNKRYRTLAQRRQFLIETIEQLEKEIFNMTLSICRDETTGVEITARMREAYRLFEQGDLDGANRILNYQQIKDERLRRKKMREDEQKKDDTLYIRELKAKIRFLTADVSNPNRFAEINEIYEDAVEVAKESLVELDVIYDYALYLDAQGHSGKAYSAAKELEARYNDEQVNADDYEKAALFNLLGVVCHNYFSKSKEAEEHYLKSIEIIEKLTKENPERYSGDLARSYNNAGIFYANQGQSQKAEEYYLKAFEIIEKLTKENPERYSGALADTYNSAGIFCADQGQSQKAEEYYLKAIEIREKLTKENPERYSGYLADSYDNAGIFYADQGQPQKAEEYYLKSIEIREKLASDNPERYIGDLADSYNNTGVFYDDQGQSQKAEKYYLKVIEIREKLASDSPERYSGDLAMSYHIAGVFYKKQEQPQKAEEYYLKAIGIYEKLADENPERYSGDLATSYNNAGNLYYVQGQSQKAEEYYLKSIEIREKLTKENPERYSGYLAISYWNFGLLKNDRSYLDKAYELARKSQFSPMSRIIIEKYEKKFNQQNT